MNRYFNVPAAIEVFFCLMFAGVVIYGMVEKQITVRDTLELIIVLIMAHRLMVAKFLPKGEE